MRLASVCPTTESQTDSAGWRAVFGNSLWVLSEKAARAVLGLTVGAWTARYLGPGDFGVFNATFAWVALFGSAAGLGIEPIVVRELVRRPGDRMTIMTTAAVLRATGGLVAAVLAAVVAAIWSVGVEPALVAIASLATLFALGETFDLWFQANLQARLAAFARTASFLVACAVRITLIVNEAPLAAFLWATVGEVALTAGLLGVLFLRAERTAPFAYSGRIAGDLLREAWPNIISNLAGMAYMRIDRVLLTAWSGNAATGIYSAAASLAEVWYAIPMALTNSATPLLTRLYSADPPRYQFELARLARMQSGMGWLLAVALAAGGYIIVPLIFGPHYTAAAPVLLVLTISLPFTFLGLAAVPWYLNERLTAVAMRRHILGAVLNIALNVLLIPAYGAVGAAVATSAGLAVAHVFANALDRRTWPVLRLQFRALALLPFPARCP